MLDRLDTVHFDQWRYVLVFRDGYWFLADAWQYDPDYDDRASIIAYGRVGMLESIAHLVKALGVLPPYYQYTDRSIWESTVTKEELIDSYNRYLKRKEYYSTLPTIFDILESLA